jgi:malto-oligosyltrehalose trehalohydrolase
MLYFFNCIFSFKVSGELPMKRVHAMPFGADVQSDGSVRFRLWAPQAQSVHLEFKSCLSGQKAIPLEKQMHGWYQLHTSEAHPGTLYRYQINKDMSVPDPASRFQPSDVHGHSEVVEPSAFKWEDAQWQGRPWEETVIYELHVGTFTPEGTFAAACERLDYLVDLGITAVELMPVADFPGKRNWGYDGALLFAPDSTYGHPENFKQFVQTAHQKGLSVLLDVVYNHFGPEGNYLHVYAKSFFSEKHNTPWGAGINFDGPESRTVRDFFIHNALYWLKEFHLDGLRIDAAHAIQDESCPNIIEEIAQTIRTKLQTGRHIHLTLENDDNASRYFHRDEKGHPQRYTAQWNDDIHHSFHCLVTGESEGYYVDYSDNPVGHLGRCLSEGFAFQGEPSAYRQGCPRGETSKNLPPTAFISFIQNHDQVGNRALGERMTHIAHETALRIAICIQILAPCPPLIFMGEEFRCSRPFLFFCDFGPDLAESVTQGRRQEFSNFSQFKEASAREKIPNPNASATFERSKISWKDVENPFHKVWLDYYRRLIAIRSEHIVPRLPGILGSQPGFQLLDQKTLKNVWILGDRSELTLIAALGQKPQSLIKRPSGFLVFETKEGVVTPTSIEGVPQWYAAWFLKE